MLINKFMAEIFNSRRLVMEKFGFKVRQLLRQNVCVLRTVFTYWYGIDTETFVKLWSNFVMYSNGKTDYYKFGLVSLTHGAIIIHLL